MKTGKVRFLMVYSDKLYEDHPNVPTVCELGFPDAAMPSFCGIYMCKDTPEPIKELLTQVSKNMSDDPEAAKGIKRLGGQPCYAGRFYKGGHKEAGRDGIPVLRQLGL